MVILDTTKVGCWKIVCSIPRGAFLLPKRGHITRVCLPPEGWEGYGPVLPTKHAYTERGRIRQGRIRPYRTALKLTTAFHTHLNNMFY